MLLDEVEELIVEMECCFLRDRVHELANQSVELEAVAVVKADGLGVEVGIQLADEELRKVMSRNF